MLELTFVRHAESENNKAGIFAGRTDCNITEEGRKKAQKLLKEDNKNFDYIYCSPLKRTIQTLHEIIPNVEPIIDERIIEVSIGEWTGKKKCDVDEKLLSLYRIGKYTPPGAETPKQVDKRVCDFVESLFIKYKDNEKILVIAHNGIMKSIKRNFIKNCENIMNKNLEIISITEKEFEYYLRNKKKIEK